MKTDFKVLYRKYRPNSFDQIVGQSYTIKMLKNAIINNKISHAYLFTGPRGTGKTSTAKIFAKTINCEHPENGIPCGKCLSCLNINNNADIIEIDAASNNGVDEIREIINNVKVAPSFSKYKVYIIDEVHMLSQSAFNALLLTLEEPPSHVVFILATTNVESVPITILSRCQRYDFSKLSTNEIEEHLSNISKKENINITTEAISEIAYLSEGGLRDALSILNQLSTSFSEITLDTVIENYGSVSNILIANIVDCFYDNNYLELEKIFQQLKRKSLDYKIFIKKIIDSLYIKALELKKSRNQLLFDKTKKTIFELNDILNKININIDPFILISIVLNQYMDVAEKNEVEKENRVETTKTLNQNIKLKEKNKSENNIDFEYLKKLKNVRINNCLAEANKECLNNLKSIWNDFATNKCTNNEIDYLLVDSDVVAASSNYAIIALSQESMAELFNINLEKIEYLLKEKLNLNYRLICLSLEEWTKVKNNYIINLKENNEYKLLEEPVKRNSNEKKIENSDINNTDYFNIFDNNKIEIQ